ncbi:MAG: MBL fold metallo-hydrolase [Clostridia bacterium]|nr:MBL fold metallo-hydrolase [Clostridia bacterium]
MASKKYKNKTQKYYADIKRKNITMIVCFVLVSIIILGTLPFSDFFESYINQEYYRQLEEKEKLEQSGELIFNNDDLVVNFISVGSADAIAIELPDDKVMLIDCGDQGSSTTALLNYLTDNVFDDRNDNVIDYLIITHPDVDHFGGADEVLRDYQVENIYRPKVLGEDEQAIFDNDGVTTVEDSYEMKSTISYNKAINAMYAEVELGAEMFYNQTGIVISNDTTSQTPYKFTFLTPSEDVYYNGSQIEANTYSAIMLLEYKGKKIMLSGDATGITENEALDYANRQGISLDCDILKVAHHGSATNGSNSVEFINAVSPSYAIFCCEEGVHSNLPASSVLERMNQCGVAEDNILRTDIVGDIVVGLSTTDELMVMVGDELIALNKDITVMFIPWFYVVFVLIFIAGTIFLTRIRIVKIED